LVEGDSRRCRGFVSISRRRNQTIPCDNRGRGSFESFVMETADGRRGRAGAPGQVRPQIKIGENSFLSYDDFVKYAVDLQCQA